MPMTVTGKQIAEVGVDVVQSTLTVKQGEWALKKRLDEVVLILANHNEQFLVNRVARGSLIIQVSDLAEMHLVHCPTHELRRKARFGCIRFFAEIRSIEVHS